MSNVEWLGEEDEVGVGQVRFAQRFSARPIRGYPSGYYPEPFLIRPDQFAQRPSARPFRGRAPQQLYSGVIRVTCTPAAVADYLVNYQTGCAENINDSLDLLCFVNKTQQWIADRISYVAQAMAGPIWDPVAGLLNFVPRPFWWPVTSPWQPGPNHGCAIQALDQNGNMILGVAGPPGVGAVDWFEGEPQWGDHGSPGLGGEGTLGQWASMNQTVPWYCWGSPGFNNCMDESFKAAQSICSADNWQAMGYASYNACTEAQRRALQFANCSVLCKEPVGQIPTSEFEEGAESEATLYPWGVYSDETKIQQQILNQFLDSRGYATIAADGKLGPETCGAMRFAATLPGGGYLSPFSTCKQFGPAPRCIKAPCLTAGPVFQPGTPLPPPPPAPTAKKGGAGLGVVLLAAAAAVAIAMAQS